MTKATITVSAELLENLKEKTGTDWPFVGPGKAYFGIGINGPYVFMQFAPIQKQEGCA